jgi:hypothetical protein
MIPQKFHNKDDIHERHSVFVLRDQTPSGAMRHYQWSSSNSAMMLNVDVSLYKEYLSSTSCHSNVLIQLQKMAKIY